MLEMSQKRSAILDRLVAPARAACNAMKDANMQRSADPLAQVLFELEGLEEERKALVEADPKGFVEALIEGLSKKSE